MPNWRVSLKKSLFFLRSRNLGRFLLLICRIGLFVVFDIFGIDGLLIGIAKGVFSPTNASIRGACSRGQEKLNMMTKPQVVCSGNIGLSSTQTESAK